LWAFTVGVASGVLVIVALPFFQSHLATPLNYFLAYLRAKHWSVVVWLVMLWLRWYEVLQSRLGPLGFVNLLAAMWAAALCKTEMATLDPQKRRPHASEETNNLY
jgi:hypothetical protein